MALQLGALRPYKSLILAHIRDGMPERQLLRKLLTEIRTVLALDDDDRHVVNQAPERRAGELQVAFLHYEESRRVTWTTDISMVDRVNHLVLICRRGRHIAMFLSDPTARGALVERFDTGDRSALGGLETIPEGLLNAAFVDGPVRTLWLSGAHRRSSVKADAKILSGLDLRDALDPLADQTYYFTAARSLAPIGTRRVPVGVAPRRSRLWVGPSRDWPDFQQGVTALLQRLQETTRPERAPLPVVAVSSIDAATVERGFDLSLSPPELSMDDPSTDPVALQELERWAYHSNFRIAETVGPNVTGDIALAGEMLGTVDLGFDLSNPERVTIEVSGTPTSAAVADLHAEALAHCRRREWLKVWYESGHTLSDGAIYEMRYRDMPFGDFAFADLTGIDVSREKPEPLEAVGSQDSLFCWIVRTWPGFDRPGGRPVGWLACDDGSMEIADFIHVDVTDRPIVSLIHVKGAGSREADRQISVSKYEVVTGQAVKNLRALDRAILNEGLAEGLGKKVSRLVWHDGERSDRESLLAVLARQGSDYERRVVIVQPHVTDVRIRAARTGTRPSEAARLRQLDALLLGASNACHALSARLTVIGETVRGQR